MENVERTEGGVSMGEESSGAISGVEVEGNTVEDAIKKALQLLNVSRNEVKIRVVCEEKKGLFGMEGEKPAKIKVTLKRKKEDKIL